MAVIEEVADEQGVSQPAIPLHNSNEEQENTDIDMASSSSHDSHAAVVI